MFSKTYFYARAIVELSYVLACIQDALKMRFWELGHGIEKKISLPRWWQVAGGLLARFKLANLENVIKYLPQGNRQVSIS